MSVTRIQPCMKDWNDVLVHRAEIPNRNYFKSIVLKEPSKPETVKIIRMSDVELTPVDWLWKPYVLIFIRDGKIIKIVENDYNEKELEALYEDIMTSGQREEA